MVAETSLIVQVVDRPAIEVGQLPAVPVPVQASVIGVVPESRSRSASRWSRSVPELGLADSVHPPGWTVVFVQFTVLGALAADWLPVAM